MLSFCFNILNGLAFFLKFVVIMALKLIEKKLFDVITLRQTKSDNINRMIVITGDFYLVIFSK